jgi:hypothetical protein
LQIISLSTETVNKVLDFLSSLPYKDVAHIINLVITEANNQAKDEPQKEVKD